MPSSSKKTKPEDKGNSRIAASAEAGPGGAMQSSRIAKYMARVGLCSRREAERWIEQGRVKLNGKVLTTPAVTISDVDRVEVDGTPLPTMERTRLWLFNKPSGKVTTNKDPEGRPTVFESLPETLPRVLSVGRLDINTEGLLLLTNDGGLARALELPATGWLRRYRVRAHGSVKQEQLDALKNGVAVDGVLYGSIEAELERQQGTNVWLTFAMREGKNREVKKVLASLDLDVNRLIRISYGPFQLGDLQSGEVQEVRGKTLRDQLGEKLVANSGANFEAPVNQSLPLKGKAEKKPVDGKAPDKRSRKSGSKARRNENPLARLDTKPVRRNAEKPSGHKQNQRDNQNRDKPGRSSTVKPKGRGNADRRR